MLTQVQQAKPFRAGLCRMAGALLLCLTQVTRAQTDAPTDTRARIAEAITDLGHKDHTRREAATDTLWELAGAAESALRDAADSNDPEISLRAHKLLNRLSKGLRPNTSDLTHELLRAYPLLGSIQKTRSLMALLEQTDAGPATVLRLILSETTAPVRQHLARSIQDPVRAALRSGLNTNDVDMIDACLRLSLLTGEKSAARDYVAYHSLSDSLPRAIETLDAQPDSLQKWHTLALSHRANANLDKALAAAEKSKQPDLARALHEERGDWDALAETLNETPHPGDIEWLGYRAAYTRLAGHTNVHADAIAHITQHVTNHTDDTWFAVEALLVNGQPEKALALVSSTGLYDILARLLYQRRDFARLLETADRLVAADVQDADIKPLLSMATRIREGDKRLRELPPMILADHFARPRRETSLQRADEAFEAEEFADAVDLYREAAQQRPGHPLPIYLEGLARQRVDAGDPQAPGLIAHATRLPLARETLRSSLAAGLSQRQFENDAARQWALLWQFSPPESPYRIDITPAVVAERFAAKQDYAEAAHALELSQLQLLRKSTSTTDVSAALAVSAAIARYRALAAIETQDLEAARHHIKTARQILPYDIELVISIFNALQSTENADLGTRLFDSVSTDLKALCADYPLLAELHNETAWMAARCRTRLEDGKILARRAVQLAPDHPEYIDTLAEILFQQHQREQAILLMQKCIQIEPDFPYFRRQLKRFQTGKPSSAPEE